MSCRFLILAGPLGLVEILRWFAVFLGGKHNFIQVTRSGQRLSWIPDARQDVLLMVRSKRRGNLQREWKPEGFTSDKGLTQAFHTWKDARFQRGQCQRSSRQTYGKPCEKRDFVWNEFEDLLSLRVEQKSATAFSLITEILGVVIFYQEYECLLVIIVVPSSYMWRCQRPYFGNFLHRLRTIFQMGLLFTLV